MRLVIQIEIITTSNLLIRLLKEMPLKKDQHVIMV